MLRHMEKKKSNKKIFILVVIIVLVIIVGYFIFIHRGTTEDNKKELTIVEEINVLFDDNRKVRSSWNGVSINPIGETIVNSLKTILEDVKMMG